MWSSAELLKRVVKELKKKDGCPDLETIYLSTSTCRERGSEIGVCTVALEEYEGLLRACRKRGIEVIFEDQAIDVRAETQLSDKFMKRMTRRRIELETSKEV